MRLPLKLRITLIFGISMAVVLVGFGTYGYYRVKADLLDSVDVGLRSRAQVLANTIERGTGANGVLSEGELIDPDEAIAQILDRSGQIIDASSAVSLEPLLTADEARTLSPPMFFTQQIDSADLDDPYRLLAITIDRPLPRIVIVGATLSDVDEALRRLSDLIKTIGPLVILFVAAAGWLLAGAALAPVEEMRQEAAAVSASKPDRRLTVPRTGDELARLATTLNVMLDRLQEAIERERRFVDSASHELRTPLATLRTEIDLALIRNREPEELEAALRSAQEDVHRLHRLTEDLLVQARLRGGRLPVRRVKTHLAALIARTVRVIEPQARGAGVLVTSDIDDAEVEVDPDRIEQAVRNLLENAIRHTPRGGTVHVKGDRTDGGIRLVVADSGPGFPPDLLATAFDGSTKGNSGSADRGLGLAIVRAVAEAHGGTVSAQNSPNGARVTLEVRT